MYWPFAAGLKPSEVESDRVARGAVVIEIVTKD
jgi:hypothetical protein